jgi:hypothetical protein
MSSKPQPSNRSSKPPRSSHGARDDDAARPGQRVRALDDQVELVAVELGAEVARSATIRFVASSRIPRQRRCAHVTRPCLGRRRSPRGPASGQQDVGVDDDPEVPVAGGVAARLIAADRLNGPRRGGPRRRRRRGSSAPSGPGSTPRACRAGRRRRGAGRGRRPSCRHRKDRADAGGVLGHVPLAPLSRRACPARPCPRR